MHASADTLLKHLAARAPAAPITKRERQLLQSRAKDLKAAAKAQGITLDAYDEQAERTAAKDHFELGCWLYHLRSHVYERDGLQHRITCVKKLFEAGISSPGYRFFTVFEFGERQFDTCFEMGDGFEVRDAMLAFGELDKTGVIAKCLREMGWVKDDDAAA